MKNMLIFLLIVFSITVVFGQPGVEWVRSFGGNTQDYFKDVYAVSNGDYVMCGYSENQLWIVRIHSDGEQLWSNTYGNSNGRSRAFTIIETDDGNFLAGGHKDDSITAILVDGEGEMIWQNAYAGSMCNAVIELKSGEFVIAGRAHEGEEEWGYVALIEGDGNLIWENSYDPDDWGEFRGMRETEGGIVLAGRRISPRSVRHGWVLKIDDEGDVVWSRYFSEGISFIFHTISSVPDDGFLLTGTYHDNFL